MSSYHKVLGGLIACNSIRQELGVVMYNNFLKCTSKYFKLNSEMQLNLIMCFFNYLIYETICMFKGVISRSVS